MTPPSPYRHFGRKRPKAFDGDTSPASLLRSGHILLTYENAPGARHSVALRGSVIDKKSATEWRAPGHEVHPLNIRAVIPSEAARRAAQSRDLSCHGGTMKGPSTTPRFARLRP